MTISLTFWFRLNKLNHKFNYRKKFLKQVVHGGIKYSETFCHSIDIIVVPLMHNLIIENKNTKTNRKCKIVQVTQKK